MNTKSCKQFLLEAAKNAREHDTPICGDFELTPLCNLDCKMCSLRISQ